MRLRPRDLEDMRHERMRSRKDGNQKSGFASFRSKGPSEWFAGTVRIDPLFQARDPAHVQGASVTFEPGARNCMAYASARSDFHRHGWLRLGSARRRTDPSRYTNDVVYDVLPMT